MNWEEDNEIFKWYVVTYEYRGSLQKYIKINIW
jgi:hypothetical protein